MNKISIISNEGNTQQTISEQNRLNKIWEELPNKQILDACCGPRMFWWNKHHPNAIYIDNRIEAQGFIDNRKARTVEPDILMDFRKMEFPDKSFKLIVFDPPHLKNVSQKFLDASKNKERGEKIRQFRMGDTFGYLDRNTWQQDLREGFDECWRVLDDYGVLIFKWGDHDIKVDKILEVLGKQPLFGHRTRNTKRQGTHWFTFMKFPEVKNG